MERKAMSRGLTCARTGLVF